jgi:hypothetical protein
MQAIKNSYGSRPNYFELTAIILAGLGHIAVELNYSLSVATYYNVAVSIAFLLYVIWRVRTSPGTFRTWGFRYDNLASAAAAHSKFLVVGIIALVVFAMVTQSPGLPRTFWLTVALYPIWGIAQQFALQNLIANNLSGALGKPVWIALVAALVFATSHYPRLELAALSFSAGFFFTLIYRKHPNLWVVGTAHGLLGSMAFYIVLREDPGAAILDFLINH